MRPRDNQRSKVYKWESDFLEKDCICNATLTLEQCSDIISKVWMEQKVRKVSVPPPLLKDGRGRRRGSGSVHAIKLPVFARRLYYLLHEISHALTPTRYASHGPEYLRIYIELLSWYCDIPKSDLLRSAKEMKLKVGASVV